VLAPFFERLDIFPRELETAPLVAPAQFDVGDLAIINQSDQLPDGDVQFVGYFLRVQQFHTTYPDIPTPGDKYKKFE
jgi:hypothetical protein